MLLKPTIESASTEEAPTAVAEEVEEYDYDAAAPAAEAYTTE